MSFAEKNQMNPCQDGAGIRDLIWDLLPPTPRGLTRRSQVAADADAAPAPAPRRVPPLPALAVLGAIDLAFGAVEAAVFVRRGMVAAGPLLRRRLRSGMPALVPHWPHRPFALQDGRIRLDPSRRRARRRVQPVEDLASLDWCLPSSVLEALEYLLGRHLARATKQVRVVQQREEFFRDLDGLVSIVALQAAIEGGDIPGTFPRCC